MAITPAFIGFRVPGSATVTYGRLYGQTSSSSFTAVRLYYGASFANIGTTEQLVGTMTSSPISCYMTKSDGTSFTGSEFVALTVYRRTKNTTDAWSFVVDYAPYASSTTYSCDFSTYDYKFLLADAA